MNGLMSLLREICYKMWFSYSSVTSYVTKRSPSAVVVASPGLQPPEPEPLLTITKSGILLCCANQTKKDTGEETVLS